MPRSLQQAVRRTQVLVAASSAFLSRVNATAICVLSTEADTGLSFARMAARVRSRKNARAHDAEKIKRYLEHARLAYDTVCSRLGTAKVTPTQLREINVKVSELRELLGTRQEIIGGSEWESNPPKTGKPASRRF